MWYKNAFKQQWKNVQILSCKINKADPSTFIGKTFITYNFIKYNGHGND